MKLRKGKDLFGLHRSQFTTEGCQDRNSSSNLKKQWKTVASWLALWFTHVQA